MENLLQSWREFLKGKRKRKDVIAFSLDLMSGILELHTDLVRKTYQHGSYEAFTINDPKPRDIHKASIRDRLIHHAIYRVLYPYFDKKFIFDSYSCRVKKGTHRALHRFTSFGNKVSQNNTVTVWVLQCDIKKFFANINHDTLKSIMEKYIDDPNAQWLFETVIDSFQAKPGVKVGLPLGNLTSQLFINIYMNEFDQFMKRDLKAQYYIRYADDFVIMHTQKAYLESLIPQIASFLQKELQLTLNPNKIHIRTLTSGIDFLGWVNFPHHRVLRTTTKRRMLYKLRESQGMGRIFSYRGLLSHGNTHKLLQLISSYPAIV